MKHIRDETCLSFWDANSYPPNHGHKLYIYPGGDCSSLIGFQTNHPRVINGNQELSLASNNCFKDIGYAEHELLHAIGLAHEQSRTDRDNYVQVLWQNIPEGQYKHVTNNKLFP
jgi:hypothetical protein